MSDCVLNLRILFWHIQWTTYGKWRFGLNEWLWEHKKLKTLLKPIQLHEFDLSKRKTEALSQKEPPK